MVMKTFEEAAEIISVLETNGYEAYFVGGCVRDSLLQRHVKDVDIATSASPEIVQNLFKKVIPVGIDHGTVVVRHNSTSFEVTTYRKEGEYSDQRHPDEVIFISNIEEDLKRRDFTINALAMDKDGRIVDLFNGINDIEKQIIRSVGEPRDRFLEDPLRIVRALRFASQLGFQIEQHTFNEMKRLQNEVGTVAVERLTNEITKLFQGDHVQNGIEYLIKTEAYKYLPVFKEHPSLILQLPTLTAFESFSEVIALFHYLDENISISNWIKQWKCSNKVRKDAINIFDSISYFFENDVDSWLLYRLEETNVQAFIHLLSLLSNKMKYSSEQLMSAKKQLPIQNRAEIDYDGYDLRNEFPSMPKGPWMNKLLTKIEYLVVMRQLKNKKLAIKEWIMCHPPEIN